MSSSVPESLDNHHRDTLLQLFQHPTSHNMDWQAVSSLLGAVGSVEQLHDGKSRARIGGETEVIARPKDKDIDAQQVVNLRRMLTGAGFAAVVEELEAEGKEV